MKSLGAVEPRIVGVGAYGTVGGSALQLATCARAQKLEPRDRPYYDKRGRFAGLALADLAADLHGIERLVALAAPALAEACKSFAGTIPAVVATFERDRPDDDPRIEDSLLERLAAASGVELDLAGSKLVRAGHAGGAIAFEDGVALLRAGAPFVVVGGVDSYYEPNVINWLDGECRLHALEAEDGFIPGEGAAFVLLTRASAQPGAAALRTIATLHTILTGREQTVANGEPNIAECVTDLVERAVEARDGRAIEWVMSDLNGERHRLLEWNKLSMRGGFTEDVLHQRMPQELGDLGAASAATFVVLSSVYFHIDCAPAQDALVLVTSEGVERGALLVRDAPPPSAESIAPPELERGPADSPARDQAAATRDALEGVLLEVRELPPRVDRGPLAQRLESAMATLARLHASDIDDVDHLDLLERSIAEVEGVGSWLSEADPAGGGKTEQLVKRVQSELRALGKCRTRTLDAVVLRQDQLLKSGAPERAAATRVTPFRASAGVPALHSFAREPIAPIVEVAPDEDAWTAEARAAAERPPSLEELLADGAEDAADDEETQDGEPRADEPAEPEPRPGPRPDDELGLETLPKPDGPLLHRLARSCIEEIGIMGNLRECRAEDRWVGASVERFEARLLANLDALIALAPRAGAGGIDVAEQLQRYVADAPTVDAQRPFARVLALCSMEGEDAVRASVLTLRQSHRSSRNMQRDAFALAPNPRIVDAMRRLAGEDDPELAALALDVLRARREVTLAVVVPNLTHPDLGVRTAAARAAAYTPERPAAIQLLERMLDTERSDRVLAAVSTSLLVHGHRSGIAFLRRRLADDLERPGAVATDARLEMLGVLALVGAASDADLLVASLRDDPKEAEAIGWYGEPAHVDVLIERLQSSRPSGVGYRNLFEIALSRALRRILGKNPRDGEEDIEDDEIDEKAFGTAYHTPHRFEDGPFGTRHWRRYWEEHSSELPRGVRHRRGRPFSPLATLDELERDGTRGAVRDMCALELDLLTKGESRFGAHDWIVRQRDQIASWRARIREAAPREPPADGVLPLVYPPGEWPAHKLGYAAS